jgi:hypothetical protein
MIRRLLNLVTVLSLLLFAAVIAAWVWAAWTPRRDLRLDAPGRRYTLYPSSRDLFLTVEGGTAMPGGGFRAPPGKHWNGLWANPTHRLPIGFAYGISPSSDPTAAPYFALVAPWWPLAALTLLLPILWLSMRLGRRLRRPDGTRRCPTCGYDLRATPDRCPECGTAGGTTPT